MSIRDEVIVKQQDKISQLEAEANALRYNCDQYHTQIAELEKEVERLKGLIAEAVKYGLMTNLIKETENNL